MLGIAVRTWTTAFGYFRTVGIVAFWELPRREYRPAKASGRCMLSSRETVAANRPCRSVWLDDQSVHRTPPKDEVFGCMSEISIDMDQISPEWTGAYLLICFPSPEPTGWIQSLSRQTGLRISWLQTLYGPETPEVFHDVDIIATLRAVPQSREGCPHLKYCHVLTAGVDYVSSSPVSRDPSIRWTTSSGIHGSSIAEWVFMTYLAFEMEYNRYREAHQSRQWMGDFRPMTHRRSLRGQRMGILGYGSIGRHVARMADSFGMEVVVFTATPKQLSNERCRQSSCPVAETGDVDGAIPTKWFHGDRKLDRFLAQGLDLLVICVPLTDNTRHLLTRQSFEILREHSPRGGAFVSNVSRGDVVAQDDLIYALNSDTGGVRGAALDVAIPEPLPSDRPLWAARNCFISPHISGQDDGYLQRGLDIMWRNLRKSKAEGWFNEIHASRKY